MQLFNYLFLVGVATALAEIFPPNPVSPPSPNELPILAVSTSKCPSDQLKGIDVVFALDVSASVGAARYAAGMKFIQLRVNSLTGRIGTGSGQTQVGLFEFDEMQYTMFELDSFKDTKSIEDFLTARNYNQNGTNSYFVKAVDYARENMFGKARGGKFQKVLAFVTDGWTDETPVALKQARIQAEADHIAIFYFYFGQDSSLDTAESLVGNYHLKDRSFSLKGFSDISDLTGCNLGNGYSDDGYCMNGGSAGCHCPPGYTGVHCEVAINSCDDQPTVNSNGDVTPIDFCHGHGDCIYNNQTGSSCVCHKPWTGQWCQNFTKDGTAAERCVAYLTNYTDTNDTAVKHLCDRSKERCIPDNIDCAFNVPIHYVDGKPRCDAGKDKTKRCRCEYPIGWCIPLEAGNNIIKAFTTSNIYVDPYFTATS